MTDITDFIAELIRAANRVERIGEFEKTRLLEQAYITIRDGRYKVGMRPSKRKADASLDLLTMSRAIPRHTDAEVRAALLDAAEMIRTLKIVLDAKDEVLNEGEEP
jgi:hypothetical protein